MRKKRACSIQVLGFEHNSKTVNTKILAGSYTPCLAGVTCLRNTCNIHSACRKCYEANTDCCGAGSYTPCLAGATCTLSTHNMHQPAETDINGCQVSLKHLFLSPNAAYDT
jgi:hypothetical protein